KENKFTGINYENPYSNEFRKEIKPHLISSNAFIKINADIFSNISRSESKLIIEYKTANGITYSYNPFYLNQYNKKNKWTHIEFAVYIPEMLTNNDYVKIFFFNTSEKETLFVKNIKIEFISLKQEQELLNGINIPDNRVVEK
ncbi:MAG: hypothetical protein K8R58_14140, partial [Bacteroidales bacterium]|nr:hypothetical protein [Bacteroidales bacterium]